MDVVNFTELDKARYEIARLTEQNRRLTIHNDLLIKAAQNPKIGSMETWRDAERYRELRGLSNRGIFSVICNDEDPHGGTYDGTWLDRILDRSRHGEIKEWKEQDDDS